VTFKADVAPILETEMLDHPVSEAALSNEIDNDNFQLTAGERRLIRNHRAMKRSAQGMLVDISEEFALAFSITADVGQASLPH
jgi:hypothetical protein